MTRPLAHLAPVRRRQLLVLTVVAVAGVLAVAAWLLLRHGAVEVEQTEQGPVILVPGYGGRVESLEPVVAALQEQGRETQVLEPVDDGTGDLGAQAVRLADLVEATLADTDAGSVDLVGYSAGGVVARLFVREGGADVVRRVLTVGSPHHGTDAAALALEAAGSCPVACEQLAPDSDLLRRLNAGDETPEGPLWATVRSDADSVVAPTDSAALDGATNVRVQDLCGDTSTSHGDLPGHPVTLALLESALGPADPVPPGDVAC